MLKRIVLIGGGVVVLGALALGHGAASYLRTAAGYARQTVKDAVPIEFEIDRARNMIQDLVPEVRKNMHVIASEEVEVRKLEEQIGRAESQLGKEKDQILKLKGDLQSGATNVSYGGRNYSCDQVKVDLANRFERYKTGDATLASLRQILDAREKSLDAARQKLDGMMASKRQLQVEVENLEARTQMIAAARSTSNYQFDDSRLGRAKELISELRTRLDVSEKIENAESDFQGEIPVDATTKESVVDEVTAYFTKGSSAPQLAAAPAEDAKR